MKLMIVIVTILITLSGFAGAAFADTKPLISRWIDNEAMVICYVLDGDRNGVDDALSCMPIKDTKLKIAPTDKQRKGKGDNSIGPS
jgi:hypothetical protein